MDRLRKKIEEIKQRESKQSTNNTSNSHHSPKARSLKIYIDPSSSIDDLSSSRAVEKSSPKKVYPILSKSYQKQNLKSKAPNIESGNLENLRNMVVKSENQAQKTSKLILNQRAQRFKENIEKEINLVQRKIIDDSQILNKTKTLGRSKDAGIKAGARYECIYKNFLRDIRQFYSSKYEKFLNTLDIPGKKKTTLKYILFPYMILQFTMRHFDSVIVNSCIQVS